VTAAPVCPVGSPSARVTAVYHQPDPYLEWRTDYSASGTLTNNGNGVMVITSGSLYVSFNGQGLGSGAAMSVFWPTDAAGHSLVPELLPPGATINWDLRWNTPPLDSVPLDSPPTSWAAKLSGWFWAPPFTDCLALGGT
jgi:hypothetical protein